MLLLPFHLRKESKALHHLVVLQVLDVLKAQQDLIRGQPIPVDSRGVVHELVALFSVVAMSQPERDSDRERDDILGLKTGRSHMELPVKAI